MRHFRCLGNEPFVEWREKLSVTFQDRVFRRLHRVQLGNFGDYSSVSDGVQELRLHFGKGYRVYYAEDGAEIVVLLCGGDKGRQARDIERAKRYWADYLMRKEGIK